MHIRAHVIISGRVQGVFFRVFTRKEAGKRNVAGWIRNLSDGRVEAVFEGKEEHVEAIIELCRIGPPRAAVVCVEVDWEEFTGDYKEFRIR